MKGVTTREVECRQYMPLKVLEQVSVNKKGGRGWKHGSWLGQGKDTCCSVVQRRLQQSRLSDAGQNQVSGQKTERKRCVRNIWNRTSTSVGA